MLNSAVKRLVFKNQKKEKRRSDYDSSSKKRNEFDELKKRHKDGKQEKKNKQEESREKKTLNRRELKKQNGLKDARKNRWEKLRY